MTTLTRMAQTADDTAKIETVALAIASAIVGPDEAAVSAEKCGNLWVRAKLAAERAIHAADCSDVYGQPPALSTPDPFAILAETDQP
jgi:hypothetical protein